MKTGRPTKYKEEYCQQIVDFMSDGASIVAFAAEIGVNDSTIYEWASVHPEFSRAKKLAMSKSQAWWEFQGRRGMFTGNDTKFSASTWIFNMKARFGYRDVQHVETDIKVEKAFNISKMTKEEYMEFISKQFEKESKQDGED